MSLSRVLRSATNAGTGGPLSSPVPGQWFTTLRGREDCRAVLLNRRNFLYRNFPQKLSVRLFKYCIYKNYMSEGTRKYKATLLRLAPLRKSFDDLKNRVVPFFSVVFFQRLSCFNCVICPSTPIFLCFLFLQSSQRYM